MALDDLIAKWSAFGWHVINVADGNDIDQLQKAFDEARVVKGKPTVLIANTIKGKGVSFMENNAGWHGKAPGKEDYEKAIMELK